MSEATPHEILTTLRATFTTDATGAAFDRVLGDCAERLHAAGAIRVAAGAGEPPEEHHFLRPGNLCPDHSEPLMLLCKECVASAERRGLAVEQEECDRCDGCGWYEGGKTLKTTCEKCGGTGVLSRVGAGDRPPAPSDVQAVNNLKDRINSLERELWTHARTEPSEDALVAAFYAIYGRKGGRPTQERDGPELVAVEKGLVAAYVVDFGAVRPPPRAALTVEQLAALLCKTRKRSSSAHAEVIDEWDNVREVLDVCQGCKFFAKMMLEEDADGLLGAASPAAAPQEEKP